MAKPSWHAAPDWANYLAQDADGDWFWFSHMPARMSRSAKVWRTLLGKVELAMAARPSPHWHQSLQARPETLVRGGTP